MIRNPTAAGLRRDQTENACGQPAAALATSAETQSDEAQAPMGSQRRRRAAAEQSAGDHGAATVAILSVVVAEAVPESVTVVD